jgi:uncharacterized protein (TIGR03086 family)
LFSLAVAQGTELIADVRPDQMADPTPCTEMNVRELLAHLVMVLERVDAAGRGLPSGEWPGPTTERPDDAWTRAWRDAAHHLQATWADDAVLAMSMTTPWGATMSGGELLTLYTNEVVVHSWDLARATGRSPVWDERAVAAAWRGISAQLPDADRAQEWEAAKAVLPPDFPWADPFANAVEVDEDAPLIDRLVAWNGRTP